MIARVAAAAWLVVVLGAGWVCVDRFQVSYDIAAFLPAGSDPLVSQLVQAVAGDQGRTLVLLATSDPPERAGELLETIQATLGEDPAVEQIRLGPPPQLGRDIHGVYYPRRHAFLTDGSAEELAARLSDDGLARSARDAWGLATAPAGMTLALVQPDDALGAWPAMVSRLRSVVDGALVVRDGHYETADGARRVAFVRTTASPFDARAARYVLDRIARVQRAYSDVTVEMAGAHRFAVVSEAGATDDVRRIGGLTLVGVAGLFLLVFKRLRYLALAALPVSVGLITGVAATLLAFGYLHAIALGFGATLIGVCVDYPIHLFVHHGTGGGTPHRARRGVQTALILGALTTIVGFGGMGLAEPVPIRQLAMLACCGVAGAVTTTLVWLPWLMASTPGGTQRRPRWAANRLLEALGRAPWAAPAIALVITVWGVPQVLWVDDVAALDRPLADLRDEEDRVRASLSRMEDGLFVAVRGDDEAHMVEGLAELDRRLDSAQADGLIGAFRSMHPFLYPAAVQVRNEAAVRADVTVPARAMGALTAVGFQAGAFAPFGEALAAPPLAPLELADLRAGPLAEVVAPFVVALPDGVATIAMLRDVPDTAALAARLADLPDVRVVHRRAVASAALGNFRRNVGWLAVGSFGLALGALALRVRRPREILALAVPPILASGAALGALGLLSEPTHVMHLVSLLLVAALSADYGILLAEHRDSPAPALVASGLAAMSTLLTFGLLAMSEFPPLRAVGITVGIGVTAGLLLAASLRAWVTGASTTQP